MDDYGRFVYLDVQKTGSTFVSEFLKEASRLPQKKAVKHGRITRRPLFMRPLYFITTRQPVSQYISLFRYGVEGRGGMRFRLERSGVTGLYSKGINPWLEYILEDANAASIGEGYAPFAGRGFGIMTYRFIALAVPDVASTLVKATDLAALGKLYDRHHLPTVVMRQETLNTDLRDFAEAHPDWFDTKRASTFLASAAHINVAKAPDPDPISPVLLDEIARKETFLIDRFYR